MTITANYSCIVGAINIILYYWLGNSEVAYDLEYKQTFNIITCPTYIDDPGFKDRYEDYTIGENLKEIILDNLILPQTCYTIISASINSTI